MVTNYKQKAKEARLKVLDMVYKAKSSHIGSNFSVIDILTVLFDKVDLKKDKILLSAGWKAASFYYFLAKAGYFPESELDTYNQEGSKLIGLTEPGVPGVYFAGGSMQMGLPAAVGFALSKKMKGEDGKVYCIMSDGEMAGGMIYESALIAAHYKLNNLVVIMDENGLQAMGKTIDILTPDLDPIWSAWGFLCVTAKKGNDTEYLSNLITNIQGGVLSLREVPKVMFCHTIKGKGVSWMENNNDWHYKDLKEDDYLKAKAELENDR